MKSKFAALFIALAFAGVANAQTVNSKTDSQATSSAANQGNAQNITFNSTGTDRQHVYTNPPVAGNSFYGSFSSDSCVTSAGGGFSGALVGINAVSPVRDEQCSVLRGVERTMQIAATVSQSNPKMASKLQQGAVDMLCMLNDVTAAALKNQGVCSDIQPAPEQNSYTGSAPGTNWVEP